MLCMRILGVIGEAVRLLRAFWSPERSKAAAPLYFGRYVESWEACGHRRIAYNSRPNRHCPKCLGAAAREWLEARTADVLPVGHFYIFFTLPPRLPRDNQHENARQSG